jgi:hypothetical protein
LNSAAFWFLPAGLIMLCQLVCLDRRYQRMNCFNIREVESLLKSRFFPDLLNSNDYKVLLNKTTLGLRFKLHNLGIIDNSFLLFNEYSIDKALKLKVLSPSSDYSALLPDKFFSYTSDYFDASYDQLVSIFGTLHMRHFSSFLDTQLLLTAISLDESENTDILRMGGYNIFELIAFFVMFFKTELERELCTLLYLLNFSKNSTEHFSWL